MKKILIGILIALLLVMAYFAIFNGISIGSIDVLSVEQIQAENEKLSQEIEQTESLINKEYRAKTNELEQSVSQLLAAKEEYIDLENMSTEGELSEANKKETYKIEFLWTKIGSYATAEGIDLKLDVLTGETGEPDVKNLSFSVTGNYIAVINFVSDIEDDSKLGFRIEDFKILPGAGTDQRQVTFMIRNVRIKQETVSESPVINTTPDNSADSSKNSNTSTNANTNTEGQASKQADDTQNTNPAS